MSPQGRRKVVVSPALLKKASREFPGGAPEDDEPSFELFLKGPLDGVKEYFSRHFAEAVMPLEGVPQIRQKHTLDAFFPAMVFFAVDGKDEVEIVDYTFDEEYWTVVGDDTDD